MQKFNRSNKKLWNAASGGDAVAIAHALAAGAELESRDSNGWTALMHAVSKGHEPCARILFDAGAEVDARDNEGMTPAMTAARRGHEPCLRALIAAGADIEARTRPETPNIKAMDGPPPCMPRWLARWDACSH